MVGKNGKSIRVSDEVHLIIRRVQLEAAENGLQWGVGEVASLLIQLGAEELKKSGVEKELTKLETK